jgi:hypothetical protein
LSRDRHIDDELEEGGRGFVAVTEAAVASYPSRLWRSQGEDNPEKGTIIIYRYSRAPIEPK